MLYYIKKFSLWLILRQLSPFDWKCLQIGTQRAKDLRKNVFIFLRGGFTSAPWVLLVIRVVLLQWLYGLSILSFHKCINLTKIFSFSSQSHSIQVNFSNAWQNLFYRICNDFHFNESIVSFQFHMTSIFIEFGSSIKIFSSNFMDGWSIWFDFADSCDPTIVTT